MKNPDTLLTPPQASEYLEKHRGIVLHPETLSNLRCQGRGPMFERDGRWIRYRVRWLDEYADQRRSAPMRSTRDAVNTAATTAA